jgi:20S proteasome subunit beta 6
MEGNIPVLAFDGRLVPQWPLPVKILSSSPLILVSQTAIVSTLAMRQSLSNCNIHCKLQIHTYPSTDKAVICVNGYHADGLQLTKDLHTNVRMYKYQHDKSMSTQSIAQLTMSILYGHRFFPYYTFTLIGGLDEVGKGAVYSFDPVGSFEREVFRAGGSASALIQPFLDAQIGRKNQNNPSSTPISLEFALKITKDAFTSAAERDIYTGDYLQIWVITKEGCRQEIYPLRRD